MNDFSSESKIWVYQSEREFTATETEWINTAATQFIGEWTAHGKLLKAHLTIYYNHFLILAVDEREATASGCGIDKSIHFIQAVERKLGINLMNRMLVAYKHNNEIKTCTLAHFEKRIEAGEITADTIVFNNLVNTKAEFEKEWEVPLKRSWHNRMLV